MTSDRNLDGMTDELLSGYVDGELGSADRDRVEAWLLQHPEDAARVRAWRADREALAGLFNAVLDEPAPDELKAAVWRSRPRASWPRAAAVAGLLLAGAVAGGAGVWQVQQQRHQGQMAQLRVQLAAGTAQGWVQRAAFAHSVYVAEPRHAVEVKAQEEHLSRWLTRRIDIPVKLFDLRAQGFELVGGRLLPDGPGKSAQLMYQDSPVSGPPRRVTVYLRKPEQGTDAAFRYEQQGAVGMFYWVEEGAGYALVGDLPKATLLALAQAIYQQHPVVPPAATGSSTGLAPPAAPPAAPSAAPSAAPPVRPASR